MPTQHGYIEHLAQCSSAGAPFVSVTLVETVGSTPQDSGTKMLVDATGRIFGTVGGGRVEHQAVAFAQKMLQDDSKTPNTLVEWNLQRDVGMTCGGVVKFFFEAYNHVDWRIAIFGAGHVAQALTRILLELDCQITCIDSRSDWLDKLPESPKLQAVQKDNPPEYVRALSDDSSLLCMTMGHRTDRPILEEIFRQGRKFPYLGVIGSHAKRKVLLRELVEAGIDANNAEAFRCPIGLDFGTNQPGEIAISVAAELIQARDEHARSNNA